MLGQVFFNILIASIYASIVGVVILLFKLLVKDRLNASWHYLIWFLLIIKLIFPSGPASSFSLFNQVPVEQAQMKFDDMKLSSQGYSTAAAVPVSSHKAAASGSAGFDLIDSMQTVIPIIWVSVAAAICIFILLGNLLLYRKLRRRSRLEDDRIDPIMAECRRKMGVKRNIRVVMQDAISTPSLLGVFWPRVLLTPSVKGLNDKEIEYILLHELAHYRRKDVLVYYLLLILQVLHWFNPILWYCFKRMRQDMELAADEMVLNTLDKVECKDYGRAILAVVGSIGSGKPLPGLVGMADSRDDIERRIRNASNADTIKNRRKIFVAAGLICAVVLSVLLLTNGRAVSSAQAESYTYRNHQQGFSLTFPASWQEKFVIKETSDTISVYNKPLVLSSPNGDFGSLFTIRIYSPKSKWETDGKALAEVITLRVLGESDKAVFAVNYPTDVQFNEEKAKEYRNMEKDIPDIIKSFKVENEQITSKEQYEQALNEIAGESRKLQAIIARRQSSKGIALGTGKFIWPVPGRYTISADYGLRYHPILKKRSMHTGLDIPAPKGSSIVAADGGTVIYLGFMGGYGKTVAIDHGAGLSTVYCHLATVGVKEGQKVKKGVRIGKAGSTGWSTGTHLHFEVRKDGVPANPHDYL